MDSYIKSHEIPYKQRDEVVLASGGVNPELAESVASSLGIKLAEVELKRHANDELYARYEESIRGKDVYVIQSHATANGYRTEEAVNEHLYLVSAAAGSSAKSVTAVAPYLAHSRGDRKSKGREVVPAPLLIQFYEAAGVHTMMSIDLHSKPTAENFRGPGAYEHLTAQPEVRRSVVTHLGQSIEDCVVVAPDAGAVKSNKRHAEELSKANGHDIGVVFIGKERAPSDTTQISRSSEVAGVDGKDCLIFDDMIDGGGTMATAAETLKNSGARAVYVGATHAIFSGRAIETLLGSEIDRVFVTDTLPVEKAKAEMGDRLKVVEIGPLIGRAIYEMVTDGSISNIFDEQNYH
jgi:ribose-phosphate pyrophosphokinase